jgi:hypothetical protein
MPRTGCSNLKSGWTRPEILGVTKLPDDAEVVPTITGAQSDLTRAVLGGGRRERGTATEWLTPGPESGLTRSVISVTPRAVPLIAQDAPWLCGLPTSGTCARTYASVS